MRRAGQHRWQVLGIIFQAGEACRLPPVVWLPGCFHVFDTSFYGEGKPVIHWKASLIKLLLNKAAQSTEMS